jgi:hypothetical protein
MPSPQIDVVTATLKNMLTIGCDTRNPTSHDIWLIFIFLLNTICDFDLLLYRSPYICVSDCVRPFVSGIRRIPARFYILLWRASECVTTSRHLLGVKRFCNFIIIVRLLRRMFHRRTTTSVPFVVTYVYAQCSLALTIPLFMTFRDHHKQSVSLFRND